MLVGHRPVSTLGAGVGGAEIDPGPRRGRVVVDTHQLELVEHHAQRGRLAGREVDHGHRELHGAHAATAGAGRMAPRGFPRNHKFD